MNAIDPLAPQIADRIARARADLRIGVPIVLFDENGGGALVLAAETLQPPRFDGLTTGARRPVMAITSRRAATLKAAAYHDDLALIALPSDADCGWVRAVADPAGDLQTPFKGPLKSLRGGDAALHRTALWLLKSARLLPAALILEVSDALQAASEHALTALPISATAAELAQSAVFHDVVSARLPMEVSEAGRLHVFRPEDGGEEHYAIEIGAPDRSKPVLARLHSACFTGDLMGSLKCDCGPQLRGALAQMGAEGAGVLLYLNQEGRGIGLANKMRAYALQDQGFDTVEANHRLGFEDDERDFRIGAALLKELGFSSVRLLTNNPAKIASMQNTGLTVTERVPLKLGGNVHNHAYLATKAAKSGHLL